MTQDPVDDSQIITAQFNGPDKSGNGGYVAGLAARRLTACRTDATVTVWLRMPPPLDKPLRWRGTGDEVALFDGNRVVAEATAGDFGDDLIPDWIAPAQAGHAAAGYPGYSSHPFPRCFVCGPERTVGDGLRIFPGPIGGSPAGEHRVGCLWVADQAFAEFDGRLAEEFVWAALDCPGGWSAGVGEQPKVLGRMTGQVLRRPAIGEACVVLGMLRSVDGRKSHATTALYDTHGELLGRAEQIWISIDEKTFG